MTGEPAGMRRDYTERGSLLESDLAADWTTQFAAWFADAVAYGLPEPNAMVVATADRQGRPSARTVLLKGYDQRGLVFYTNTDSQKGRELGFNPRAALAFTGSRSVAKSACAAVSKALSTSTWSSA